MGIARAVAAPAEIRLGGKAWRLRPLDYAAIGEYEQWVQDSYIATIERLIVNLSPESAEQMRKDAVVLAAKIGMTTADPEAGMIMARASASLEGGTRLLWLSIRPEQPETTLEEIGAILADPGILDEALRHFNRLNAGPDDAPGKPKRPRRARKTKSR